jgi:hypothetical protein
VPLSPVSAVVPDMINCQYHDSRSSRRLRPRLAINTPLMIRCVATSTRTEAAHEGPFSTGVDNSGQPRRPDHNPDWIGPGGRVARADQGVPPVRRTGPRVDCWAVAASHQSDRVERSGDHGDG